MLGIDLIQLRHQETCVKGGRYLCLLSAEEGAPVFASAKIVGKDDNPADWLAIIQDVGRGCAAIQELPVPTGVNLNLLAEFCLSYINDLVERPNQTSENPYRGESAIRKYLESKGVLGIITACLDQAFLPVYLPQQV